MRRSDICLYLGPADSAELQALLSNRNTPRKLAWRAEIVLATADGQGTVAIMRRTGMSKPTVWRWQERYLAEGVPGLGPVCIHLSQSRAETRKTKPMKLSSVFSQRRAMRRNRLIRWKKFSTLWRSA